MVCPACHSRAKAGSRFCRLCGQNLSQPVSTLQSSAGQAAPPERALSLDDRPRHLQRYVPQHLADKILANRGRLEGERKLVTVLFADIAGYTMLGEQLGEEALFRMMDDLYERFIHEVHRYEGTVNELTGDGIVAFFGAPLAVEQAPQRAVRAAFALHETMAQISARFERQRGIRVQLRVGINTGPVIVGSIGNDLRMDYKAVGSTVNLAARMEQTAAPGTIQITAQTYKLVEGYFDCEDQGLVAVKGATSKVRVYRVTGEGAGRARIDVARERGFTRLVGRDRELELLRHCFDLVQDRRGQAISIIGDAGLGKSRLLYECRQLLAGESLTWLDGRCSPYGTALAYLPIIELLKQHFRIDASDSDTDIEGKVHRGLAEYNLDADALAPYLLHVLAAEDSMPSGISPEALKRRIFEALQTLVIAIASHRPLVVALEDLHWVDKTTEEWLTALLDRIAGARVLLVCTYRPDFVSAWSRKSYHNVVTLTRLGPQDSYRMLTSLLGTARIPDNLARLVLDKAEGVPFFLEELVHALRETGAIALDQGEWRLSADAAALQVPDTVHDVLMARIDRLPEGAKRVLQIGAVIGREFGWELLHEVSGLSEGELTGQVTALTHAELIYARGLPPRLTYIFKHALTQEAAYRSLLTAQRQALHHQVGVTLEALFPDRLEEYYGQLAHHFLEAAQPDEIDKAIAYARLAGERSMALPAYAEAVRFYQMALDALANQAVIDEAQCCELLLALGVAQRKAGENVQALDTLQRAADSAQRLKSCETLARVAIEFERATLTGKLPPDPTVPLLEEVLSSADEIDEALQAQVLGCLARALLFTGAAEPAAAYAQRAVEIARRVGDPGVLASNLEKLLHQPWRPEESEGRLAYATEMLQRAEQANSAEFICSGYQWRVILLLELGRSQEADAAIVTLAQEAEKLQEPFYFYINAVHRTTQALLTGRFGEAERLALHAFALGQRMQIESLDGTFGLHMFTIRREQGRLTEVEPALRHFMQQQGAAVAWQPGLALLYSELGREREARAAFEHLAQHDFANLPRDALWVGCITYLAEVCAFLGDAARAATLYQLLLPYAGHAVLVGSAVACYGAASRYLGLLATTMARWDEAEQHFKDALAMNTRMGARPWLAHTQHDYATMLLARNRPGDADQAATLLHEALTTAQELDMRALADRLTANADQHPSAPASLDLDDLSPREVDVLRLLAAGKSNREIADTLYISLNTVATHVRNILAKTSSANRTEAAAYAMRCGLTDVR
jgi:predicted ATPase/class 3 adenylate cyclase/DNA-binding CsgD family transcriptional regulator